MLENILEIAEHEPYDPLLVTSQCEHEQVPTVEHIPR